MCRRGANPWLILVLVWFAQFMVVLDATVVNVALPSIQNDLGLSEAGPAPTLLRCVTAGCMSAERRLASLRKE